MDLNAVAALIQERDELKGHALRLAEEVESAAQTNIALTGRLTVAETQREALQAERDELKGHLARLAAELAEAHAQILAGQPISLFVEPGHFYSPRCRPGKPLRHEGPGSRRSNREFRYDSRSRCQRPADVGGIRKTLPLVPRDAVHTREIRRPSLLFNSSASFSP